MPNRIGRGPILGGICAVIAAGMILPVIGTPAEAQGWINRYAPSGQYGGYGYYPRVHYPRPGLSPNGRSAVRPAPAGIEGLATAAPPRLGHTPYGYHRMPPNVVRPDSSGYDYPRR